MSRDFVGALLQLNAEKQVSREALVRALEEGIQAAYRRVAGEEDIFVRVEPRAVGSTSIAASTSSMRSRTRWSR